MAFESIFVLGRQPAIGRAELESLFGASQLTRVGNHAVAARVAPQDAPFDRLGGSVRLARTIAVLDAVTWPDVVRAISTFLPDHLSMLPAGKLKLGLSVFDVPASPQQLFRTGLELKKVCQAQGRSVRLVPNNNESALSSAQVLHNSLTGDLGLELLAMRDGDKTWLAQTVAVQNINAYAARDQHRPKRDARVGMLPPKLAQIIVNLAAGPLAPIPTNIILDPFCGTGVILQEAALMEYGQYGTDLEPRMIDYTKQNLDWLARAHHFADPVLEAGDATTHQWQHAFSAVASETYLGRPLSGWPAPDKLRDIIGTCNVIIEKFLSNMAEQTASGLRLCLAVPTWQSPDGRFYHLPLLDHLENLGYNRVSFEHTQVSDLVYSRPEQFVARELLVITRK